jgi:hypothetical protein
VSIANLIASNSALALSLIKQIINAPVVGSVVIQASVFRCVTDAEVSRHVLIRSTDSELQSVTDSVAPGPRTWEIEGYVGGFPIELTSLYMPSLNLYIDLLYALFSSRAPTTLLDPFYRNISNVLISHFEYSKDPLEQNRVAVKMSMVEITVLTVESGTAQSLGQKGVVQPSDGGSYGSPAKLGSTGNSAVGTNLIVGGVAVNAAAYVAGLL